MCSHVFAVRVYTARGGGRRGSKVLREEAGDG